MSFLPVTIKPTIAMRIITLTPFLRFFERHACGYDLVAVLEVEPNYAVCLIFHFTPL
jgi:hypothetical protein